MTAKTRAIPSLHRDCFLGLPGQVHGRLLRRVTQPPFIAGPLAFTWYQIITKTILDLTFAQLPRQFHFDK
jgi:hypothetical protein